MCEPDTDDKQEYFESGVRCHLGKLPDPETKFGELLRELASAAMSVNHHDIAADEPEYRHEVTMMEKRFRVILNHYRGVRGAARRVRPEQGRPHA